MRYLLIFWMSSILLLSSEAEELYKKACISCHSDTGETKLDRTILNQKQSFAIIKEGAHFWGAHSDIMPAFKYLLSDKQIYSLAHYVSQTFNKNIEIKTRDLLSQSTPLSTQELQNRMLVGEKIFKKSCALCHGIKGDAVSEYTKNSQGRHAFIYPYNLTRTLLREDQIFLFAKYGGKFWGTDKADMPAWGKRYNDIELKSVAHYIQNRIKKLD